MPLSGSRGAWTKLGLKRESSALLHGARLSLDLANRSRWIIKRAGNLAATWEQASLELSRSAGAAGSVWVMHQTAEIQQHSLRWTQKTNRTVMGTERCVKQLQCQPRNIQNIKAKWLRLEHCSRMTGFLCWALLPARAVSSGVHPVVGRWISEATADLT